MSSGTTRGGEHRRASDYTPTTGEVERAWMMRQFALDVEAGREPDPVQYVREFRRWLDGHDERVRFLAPAGRACGED